MKASVGYSESPDSALAGRMAAQNALDGAERTDICDMTLLFCTARHDQEILRDSVAEVVGGSVDIYGGGSAGIITNDTFGYAGDQVGVVCFWFDGLDSQIITEAGLLESEEETGIRLGKRLKEQGIRADSPLVLFYGAIHRAESEVRILMATWLLEGLQKGLGFLPDIVGAGLQGDHVSSPTKQYIGEGLGEHYAMAMSFSDEVCMHSTIMHGCRPASAYYTVTKADGPVILEINDEPAIPFIDKVLGSSVSPQQYPFFLLFGLNHGNRWGDYDEDNYASRLCLGLDEERQGIIMFEPDMVAGTEFQLMVRSSDFEYMKPKIEEVFDRLDGREPFFALYIDCAGRCAGYGGTELEDAVVLQEIVGDRVPLLGLYTGVEIASIGGRPRGLDWTGVFCLFSKGEVNKACKKSAEHEEKDEVSTAGEELSSKIPFGAMKQMAEDNAAKILELETKSIAIRHELEQKRRGFSLLAELAVSLRQSDDYEVIFNTVSQSINSALNMQKTVILLADGRGNYVPLIMQGYSAEERAVLEKSHIVIESEMLDPEHPLLITAEDDESAFSDLRTTLNLPYLISAPVIVGNEVVALLITGRMVEAIPFLSRLGHNDVETVQAISALLSTVLVYQRLEAADKKAQLDPLTSLYNRDAFETRVTSILRNLKENDDKAAFLMIDFDNFKEVNDTYGHMQGDIALKTLATTLRNNYRSTDIVARFGGDEFAVFCPSLNKIEEVTIPVERLMKLWRDKIFYVGNQEEYHATLSIGISVFPDDGSDYQELYQRADSALYASKQDGRDRYTLYTE